MGTQPTEEELRAAYEAEMSRIRVDDLLLDSVVNMVNFGMRRTGLVPGTEAERDPQQVQLAIESVRALLPIVEQIQPGQVAKLREALTQLQLAYVRIGGAAAPPSDAPRSSPGAGQHPTAAATSEPARGSSEPAPAPATGEPASPAGEPAPATSEPGGPRPHQRARAPTGAGAGRGAGQAGRARAGSAQRAAVGPGQPLIGRRAPARPHSR